MRIVKPGWITHSGSIESVDISPDGLRLATCGVDSKIRIWSMLPMLDPLLEKSSSAKLLGELNDHISGVNVVRWCPVGLLLASGSMDKSVILYHLDSNGSSAFGSAPTPEHWRQRSVLRGFHSTDVSDLSFSPDGNRLVSCDFAGDLVVWDVRSGRCLHHKQKAHKGAIKGVAWDPLNRYVATQGVDRSVRIWRTDDWECEAKIKEPLKDATEVFQTRLEYDKTSCVRELTFHSWSPDGMYLSVPNVVKDKFFVCAVFDRAKFEHQNEFVGHRGPVVVARWNPLVFPRSAGGDPAVCCAVGSYDKGVSVWHSAKDRPVAAIKDLFQQHVTDLAWAADGLILAACSNDGTVALLQFQQDELGRSSKPSLGLRSGADEDAIAEDPALVEMLEASVREKRAAQQQAAAVPARAPQVNVLKPRVRTSAGPGASGHRERPPVTSATVPMLPSPAAPVPHLAGLEAATAALDRREERVAAMTPTLVGAPAAPVTQPSVAKRKRAPRPTDSADGPAPRSSAADAEQTLSAGPVPSAAAVLAASPLELARSLGRVLQSSVNDAVCVGISQGDVPLAVVRSERSGPSSIVTWTRVGDRAPRWESFVQGTVFAMAGTVKFVAVLTTQGTLCLLDATSGRLLLPLLVLSSSPHSVAAGGRSDSLLFVVCADASCILINVTTGARLLESSVLSIVRRHPSVTLESVQILSSETPAILMSDGASYFYHHALGMWCIAADPSQRATEFTADTLASSAGVLAGLQSRVPSFGASRLPALHGDERTTAAAATAFLESQMSLSQQLGSVPERQAWTLAYARHLAAAGDEGRLRALLSQLLGTPSAPGDHALLRQVFAAAARQQRIVSEYVHALEVLAAQLADSMVL